MLVSDTTEEINSILDQWREALEDNGLRISREKTGYQKCDFDKNVIERNDGGEHRIVDHILNSKESFRYLGSMLH